MDTLNDLVCTLTAIHLLITLLLIITFIIADELNQINPWSKDSLKMDKLKLNISILWIITLIIIFIGISVNDAEVLTLLSKSLLSLVIFSIISKAIRWIIRKIYKEENK